MSLWLRVLFIAGPLLLLLLTAVAGYAYSQIRYLSLPIPQALALFTVVLPLITGISTQGVYNIIQRPSKHDQYRLTIPLIAVIGFQLMYETIVATLALTHMLPPETLRCSLNDTWGRLFGNIEHRDGRAIRAIQDSFNCCGLNSVKDRAFPFGEPSTCAVVYDRTKSCFGPWRQAEQVNAGLLLLVAVVVFIVKLGSILTLLTSSRLTIPRRLIGERPNENGDEDSRATMRRLIEGGSVEEPYRDEPDANGDGEHGPRVQPSALGETYNEWADDEQCVRDARVSL